MVLQSGGQIQFLQVSKNMFYHQIEMQFLRYEGTYCI